MREQMIPVSYTSKYDSPYTTQVLRLETVSSLAQKLFQDKKVSTIEEALEKAKILIKKVGHLETAPALK